MMSEFPELEKSKRVHEAALTLSTATGVAVESVNASVQSLVDA